MPARLVGCAGCSTERSWVRDLDIGEISGSAFGHRHIAGSALRRLGAEIAPGWTRSAPWLRRRPRREPWLRQRTGGEPAAVPTDRRRTLVARWTRSEPWLRGRPKREPWLCHAGSKTPASAECVGAGVACGGYARERCEGCMQADRKLSTRGLQRAGATLVADIRYERIAACGCRTGCSQLTCGWYAGVVRAPCQHGVARLAAAEPRAPRARRFRPPSSRRTGCAGS